jgi:cell division protein FtsZ
MTEQLSLSGPTPGDGMAQVKVIGIGGGGCNAVARMYRERVPGVEYIAVNTDAQHLQRCELPVKIRIGDKLTRGLGVGGNPEIGRAAAEESREELYEVLRGADLVFIATGMGGGTGTGAAPVVAAIARDTGALTIAVVTKPFDFEGRRRSKNAEDGIDWIKEHVDTLITIPNDRLTSICDENVTAESAFMLADGVLRQGVQSIAELVTVPGEINLDFADVKTIMSGAGPAWMAIGHARGENRAVEAAKAAINSPMLDVSIEGARGVLFNITGGPDLTLLEVQHAAEIISRAVDPEANIIFGMVTDLKMEDEVRVTIIATGLPTIEPATLGQDGISDFLLEALGGEDTGESDLDLPPFLRTTHRVTGRS